MGSRDIPQWLVPAYVRSVRAVGAKAETDTLQVAGRDLLDRWAAPERHFHGVRHLKDTLARADELAPETHHPDIVRLAVWYHGAVFSTSALKAYRRSAGEDKEASALFAVEHLTGLGVSRAVAERIAFLILDLKRHDADPGDIDAQALSDADLGTIAAEPQKYRTYRKLVAQEFAHIPRRHYLEARERIVTRLLERRRLFRSPLAQAWEQQARENLLGELAGLRSELAAMGECDAADHLPTSPDQESEDAARAAAKVDRHSPSDRAPAVAGEAASTLRRVRPTAPLDVPAESYPPAPGRGTSPVRPVAARDPLAEDPLNRVTGGPSAVDLRSSLEDDPEALFASLDAHARRPAPRANAREAQEDNAEASPDAGDDDGEQRPEEDSDVRYDEHLSGIEREPDLSTGRRRAHH